MNRYYYALRSFLTNLFHPAPGGILNAVLLAYAAVFQQFDDDFLVALQQMNVLTSRGFFLNFWGYLLKVKRYGDIETDENYAQRIVRTVLAGRNTASGILAMVQGLVSSGATVTEFTAGTTIDFDYSTFSYNQHYNGHAFLLKFTYRTDAATSNTNVLFIGQSYIGYNAFLVSQSAYRTTSDTMIQELVDSSKLAGVKVIYSKQ